MAILKKGLSGEAVRRLQTKLGVTADTAKASRKHLGHHQGRIHVRDGPRRPQSGDLFHVGRGRGLREGLGATTAVGRPVHATARITSRKRDGKDLRSLEAEFASTRWGAALDLITLARWADEH